MAAQDNKTAQSQRQKMSLRKKLIIIFAVLAIALVLGLGVALSLAFKSIAPTQGQQSFGRVSFSTDLLQQSLLQYSNGTYLVPYALYNYSSRNATNLFITSTLWSAPTPTHVYLLNSSNECYDCGNVGAFASALAGDLGNYSIFNGTNRLQLVQPSAVSVLSMQNSSILIVPNGYLPDFFLNTVNGTRILDTLLSRGTTVIYIGQNFSKLITPQSVLILTNNLPPYLDTGATGGTKQTSFYFNNPNFAFSGGTAYGPVSYEAVSAGYIVAFSNYLASWKTPQQAASDIAASVFQLYWLPKITQGTAAISVRSPSSKPSSGSVGIILNQSSLGYTSFPTGFYALLHGRTVVEASNNAFSNASGTSYKISYFTPSYALNGSLSIPNQTFPGHPINAEMQIYLSNPALVEPHIDIYSRNLTYVESLPPIFSKTINSSYTFFHTFTLSLPAGTYIAQLNGFNGEHYASSYFSVPGVIFSLQDVNFSQGTFTFSASAGGVGVSGESAQVKLNGENEQTVSINNGGFVYSLPLGASVPTGNLTFSINVLNQTVVYNTYYAPPAITINKQYIEFIIAIIIVILEITLVKAPTRDDFYVDVPNMPEPQKMQIKLKSNDVMGVFDKLNLYYHWRYMPLSTTEFRFAISNNLRSGNMPVTLTHSNIDIILDNLVSKGLVVDSDGLYAPATWIDQSKHDIEYLATFKKMRVYLVSHAHIFTDLDKSDAADIVTTLHNEKAYIVIYSNTSKFMGKIPLQPPIKTYIAFLNSDRMDEFKRNLANSTSVVYEELKLYISTGSVVLLDSDNPEGLLT